MARSRLTQLDMLRGIAILLVLGRHMPAIPGVRGHWVIEFLLVWKNCGWIGVDLFFVLSGFLVSGLLFSEYKAHGEIDLLRFFVRRGFKIYPGFYFLCIVSVIFFMTFGYVLPKRCVVSELFFIQNYTGAHFWAPTWSLAVEEHFYLLLGVLLLVLARQKGADPFRVVVAIFFVLASLCLIMRSVAAIHQPTVTNILVKTHLRIDSLFFGVLLSYLHHFRGPLIRSWAAAHQRPLFLTAVLFILPSVLFSVADVFTLSLGLTLLYLGFGTILMLMFYSHRPAFTENPAVKALSFIGVYSYSIYLWHVPVRTWLGLLTQALFHRPLPFMPEFLLYIVTALLMGILMSKMIEVPFLKIRDRLFLSRSLALDVLTVDRSRDVVRN